MSSSEEIIKLFNFIGSLTCHQKPERTLWIGGYYLPVCARCTGAYLGFLLGYFLIPFLRSEKAGGPPNLYMSLILTLPLWIDSIGQTFGFWNSVNDVRLITGLLFGITLAPLLVYTFSLFSFSNRVSIFKKIKPEIAILDDRNSWFNLKAQVISIILSGLLFFVIRLMTNSSFYVFYWMVSIPIVLSILLHFFILPLFLIGIIVIEFISIIRRRRN